MPGKEGTIYEKIGKLQEDELPVRTKEVLILEAQKRRQVSA
jgi:hypothetical protein